MSMISSRAILTTALSALMLLASTHLAKAQELRLIFASGSPAGTPNSVFYQKWVDRVNEQGKGVLRVELRDGESIANFINVHDRVQNDVVQIGWTIHSLLGNKFPLTDVVSLPFQGDNNVACSAAFWRMYKSGFLDSEYQDVVPIWFGCLTASYLHWAKAPRSLEDLNGLKFRVNGKLPGRVIQLLGGTPVSLAGGEMYEGLQRGTIASRRHGPASSHTSFMRCRSITWRRP
jgi:TRAP-type C4-dicarboxylate transport system substrate-binding protein